VVDVPDSGGLVQHPFSKPTRDASRPLRPRAANLAGIRVARFIVFLVTALLAGLALYLGLQLPRLDASLSRLARANEVQRDLAHLSDDASDIETAGRGYVLTVDDAYLAPYRSGTADAAVRLSRLRSELAGDAESLRRLGEISRALEGKLEHVERYVQLARAGDTAEAVAVIRDGRGKRLMDEFRLETAGLADRWSVVHAETDRDVASHQRSVVLGVSVVLSVALLLIILAWELGRRYAAALDAAGRETRNILDSLAEGVLKQSSDGVVVGANRSAAEILGLTADELIGRDSYDPRWSAIREDGTPFPGAEHPGMVTLATVQEVRGVVMGVTRPNGERAWLLINSVPINGASDGSGAASVTSFLDITRLREEHQARIASETRVRALIENMPDAVIVGDAEGRILEANRAASEIWGYSHQELLRMNVTDIGQDMTGSDPRQVVDRLSPGGLMTLARVHRRKDGTLIPTETSLTVIVEHGERRILAVVRDVSHQREAELAMTQSEERLRQILGHVPAPIAHFDGNGVCLFANAAMESWCAGHPSRLEGQRVSDLECFTSGGEGPRAYEAVRRGRLTHFDWVGAQPGQSPRFATIAFIPDAEGEQPGGFFCLVTDTTALTVEVQARTRELAAALEVARTAVSARDEFLANASHEMRTPLHAIRAFSDLAMKHRAKSAGADEKLSRYLVNIQDAAARLSSFVEDILELVRLQSGSHLLRSEMLDVRRNIEAVVQSLDAELRARALTVRVQVETRDPCIAADPGMLDRLLRALIFNAIKFSPTGAEIAVALSDGAASESAPATLPALRVSVFDGGPGIPEDELELIFGRFRQSSRTRTGAGGAGLGLSLCRAIMLAHGGAITARNLPGGGAAFDAVFSRTPTTTPARRGASDVALRDPRSAG